jgi:hypothetical protein
MLGWLFIFISATAWAHIGYLKIKVKKSMSWPSTQGEVIQSEVVLTGGGGVNINSSPGHSAIIQYQYHVRDRRYQSDNFLIGGNVSSGNKEKEENKVRQYPVGTKVEVFYNPENPEDVCLERKQKMAIVAWLLSMFLFFGLLMVTGVLR